MTLVSESEFWQRILTLYGYRGIFIKNIFFKQIPKQVVIQIFYIFSNPVRAKEENNYSSDSGCSFNLFFNPATDSPEEPLTRETLEKVTREFPLEYQKKIHEIITENLRVYGIIKTGNIDVALTELADKVNQISLDLERIKQNVPGLESEETVPNENIVLEPVMTRGAKLKIVRGIIREIGKTQIGEKVLLEDVYSVAETENKLSRIQVMETIKLMKQRGDLLSPDPDHVKIV